MLRMRASAANEIIDAFQPKAFHVGMDEVFLLHSDHARSTKKLDPADVFAKVVNDVYGHIVAKRGLTMLMWADRLIDGNQFNMGEWEASKVGTAPAIDKIPKDIILCPWHYEMREKYESVPMFMSKGFRVLPASWKNAQNQIDPTTPLNFVCTADITGGNSGSPVVNRAGELVGVIFDSNRQGVANELAYTDIQARAVAVDSRAILHALSKIYHADRLVDELTNGRIP